MLYIIQDNAVKFIVENDEVFDTYNAEEAYTVLKGSDNSYYDSEAQELKLIPTQPSPNSVWMGSEWVEPPTIDTLPSTVPDFIGFMESIRGNDIYKNLKVIGTKSTRLNLATTLLRIEIGNGSIVGIEEAFADLRSALVDSTQTSDFTDSQIDEINQALAYFNIPIQLEYSVETV